MKKIPSFKDYKIDENAASIELTMEATGVSREEAIRVIKKLSYRLDYGDKKKKNHAA